MALDPPCLDYFVYGHQNMYVKNSTRDVSYSRGGGGSGDGSPPAVALPVKDAGHTNGDNARCDAITHGVLHETEIVGNG